MAKFQRFTAEQQAIIDQAQSQMRARYQANPQGYDSAEGSAQMEAIAGEAFPKVVALMPDDIKFRASDIEQAFPRAARAIRRHLDRLAETVDDHRQLYQDGAWYEWTSEE